MSQRTDVQYIIYRVYCQFLLAFFIHRMLLYTVVVHTVNIFVVTASSYFIRECVDVDELNK